MSQLNVRIPKSVEQQIQDIIDWTGMTQTQIVIQAIDRMHQEYKRERERDMGFTAYQRSINAGFATETILVLDGVIVDQFVNTFNAAAQVEGLPDLIGKTTEDIKGKGFRRITSQRRLEELQERYESIQESLQMQG